MTVTDPIDVEYLYIIGGGYSGSTILSMLVGHSPAVASEGEILWGLKKGYQDRRCVTGERFSESPFWQSVTREFERRTNVGFDEAVSVLSKNTHYINVLRNLFSRTNSSRVKKVKDLITGLYDSIAQISGSPVVLDSSKELPNGVFLTRHMPTVKIIHVVRDPYGVVNSYVKRIKLENRFDMFRRRFNVGEGNLVIPVFIASLFWLLRNLICEMLRILYPKKILRIRYEDLCLDPIGVLTKIERLARISLEESKQAIQTKAVLKTNHGFCGNRIMYRQGVVFDPKVSDKPFIGRGHKLLTRICTFPLALAYGYLKPGNAS